MRYTRVSLLFLITIILAACASPSATQPVEIKQAPIATFPTSAPLMNYPQPANATPFPTELPYPSPASVSQNPSTYPGPGTQGAGQSTNQASGYAPQPGDDKLSRGQAPVDIAKSSLITTGSQPLVVTADLQGYLPDPCHQLRIINTPADNQNKIQVEVYSVYDASQICITVIQPFQVQYQLGSYTSGHYTVYVNGEMLGEFDG
jgi:hypothetical protein